MAYTPTIRSLAELRQCIAYYSLPSPAYVSLALIGGIGPQLATVRRDLKNPGCELASKLLALNFDPSTILADSALPLGAIPVFLLHYSQAGHPRAVKVAALAGVWQMLSSL